jgi:cyclic-di-AMP phosphodiesterase PgpH
LNIIGMIIIILSITIIANYYFVRYKPKFMQEQKKLIFLELMVVIILIIAKIINYFQISYLIYLVPVAMASILTAVLINTDIAVMLTVFLSLLTGLVFNSDFSVVVSSFIGGLVGIFSVARVNQRNDLVRAGFNVSWVLVIVILGLTMNMSFSSWLYILWSVLTGVLNGILVAILANGLLPYLENAFGMTSSVKLLELSNPSQPLLKKLLVEAPGTYHHSVIVGNLAETAADNIGANSLLTRVGAYYHDIGKMKRAYFFTDNQFGGENPHDKLSPNLSSLIIKSHVKDGVEMAREHNLPESIIDIIKEHHGTNLISFFYQEAMKDNKHDSVEEGDFHYDGPKPQSRESAIIMLADIVEASLRSKQFNKSNHNRIEGMVRELIREKLTEGQLDESELTLKDLDIIVDSFVKVLTGIYHQRVDYPEKLIKEMKRADRSDKNRDK